MLGAAASRSTSQSLPRVAIRVLVVFQTMSLPGQFAPNRTRSVPSLGGRRRDGVLGAVYSSGDRLHLETFDVGITVLGLLIVVMRALLRQAARLRADMEAVI